MKTASALAAALAIALLASVAPVSAAFGPKDLVTFDGPGFGPKDLVTFDGPGHVAADSQSPESGR